MENLRLSGGTLVTESQLIKADLLIENGFIKEIIDENQVTQGYKVIDCSNLYVSAGFIDIHQHGGGGADYMDGENDTYLKITEAHLKHGTTSVMPTLLSATKPALIKAVEGYLSAEKDDRIRANLLGLHLEGRYIAPSQAGAQKEDRISNFNSQEYSEIIEKANGRIKRWSVAPELLGAEEFANYANKNGIVLSIAHSDADFDTTLKAFDLGFKHVTHFYSCTSSIVRKNGFRIAGIVEATYYLDDMNVEIIADGCHLPHSLLKLIVKLKGVDNVSLITDAMRAAGENVTESYLGSLEDPLPVVIEDGVAKLLDKKAFGGSIATSDRLVKTMLDAGVDLVSAVKMLTINPLKQMNLKVKRGKIEKGYFADLCVFDKDVNVKKVIVNGKIAY